MNSTKSVWFNTDPLYDCIFIMRMTGTAWLGETEFVEEGLRCEIKLGKGHSPGSLGWVYIGEFEKCDKGET